MPNGDPRDKFFYITLTLIIDSYSIKIGKPLVIYIFSNSM